MRFLWRHQQRFFDKSLQFLDSCHRGPVRHMEVTKKTKLTKNSRLVQKYRANSACAHVLNQVAELTQNWGKVL